MTKVILVGDIHAMDKPPASVSEDYMTDIYDLLDQVAKLEKEHEVDAVVWAGDVFNFPNPQRSSHSLVMRMTEAVQKFDNLYICIGNHDMCVSDDTEALTNKGWKKLDQLTGDETFATRNRVTGAIEFQKPTKIHRMNYSGEERTMTDELLRCEVQWRSSGLKCRG